MTTGTPHDEAVRRAILTVRALGRRSTSVAARRLLLDVERYLLHCSEPLPWCAPPDGGRNDAPRPVYARASIEAWHLDEATRR